MWSQQAEVTPNFLSEPTDVYGSTLALGCKSITPCQRGPDRGVSKQDLLARLRAAQVQLNPLASLLFERSEFTTAEKSSIVETVRLPSVNWACRPATSRVCSTRRISAQSGRCANCYSRAARLQRLVACLEGIGGRHSGQNMVDESARAGRQQPALGVVDEDLKAGTLHLR